MVEVPIIGSKEKTTFFTGKISSDLDDGYFVITSLKKSGKINK